MKSEAKSELKSEAKLEAKRACEVLANKVYTVELKQKMSLMKAKEWATSACRCRHVSVQGYSVQYKGYNLIRDTTVEGGATRGMTALAYWHLHSSLYTGAVQCYWSTPDWSDRRQGCRQMFTIVSFLKCCIWWYWGCNIFFGYLHRWGRVAWSGKSSTTVSWSPCTRARQWN